MFWLKGVGIKINCTEHYKVSRTKEHIYETESQVIGLKTFYVITQQRKGQNVLSFACQIRSSSLRFIVWLTRTREHMF